MNATITLAQEQFQALFRDTPRTFPQFDPKFHNGTGYFDRLCKIDLQHPTKTVDENNRKIVVIPMADKENIVIFERYRKNEAIIAFNIPHPRTSECAAKLQDEVVAGHHQRFDDELTIEQMLDGAKAVYNK